MKFKIPRSVISQLLYVWLAFALMVLITFFFVSNIVQSYLAKEAENILSYTRSRITADLREAETILQTVSQNILIMILRGDSAEVVHKHMLEITDYLASDNMRVSGFNGIYGFFYKFAPSSPAGGMFLDGSGWVPPDDYMPKERPWYIAAIEANGNIASTTPYISLFPGAAVISYSRLIFDNDGNPLGVICSDIRLDKMADYVVNMRLAENGFGMLLSKNLEIIATLSKEHIGKHLTELPDKGITNAVNKLNNGIDIFEYIIRDDAHDSDFILFTKRLENGWHIGIFTPIDKYYRQVTSMRFFIAILGIILAFTLSLVLLRIAREKQKADEESLEAKAASKTKSDFLATMSHEMRTPLNVIIGLSETEMQETNKSNIAQIHRCGTTLLEIVNDILDISKIEAGKFELYPDVYDTALMLNDTIVISKVRIGSMPINFVLEIDGSFPGKLIGDELRVKQILNNLLSNAIKYTKRGTVTLGVSFLPKDAASVIVRFKVEDTGIGIRAQDMDKLFTNYIQLDAGANRKTEGTGLGLPIVKNLAELMNGGITVKSEYGKGSCFTAEIIQGFNELEPIGNETAENLRSFNFADERKKDKIDFIWVPETKVLVVDDIRVNQTVMKGLLAPYGLDVKTAISGEEAVNKVMENEYDIVFMDHMMPEMDGVEVTAKIRAWEKDAGRKRIQIIAMTANAISGMREFYLENGFDDYISKPVIPEDLHDLLIKWVKEQPKPYPEQKPQTVQKSLSSLFAQQCADVLMHYCVTFKSAHEIKSEYYLKFTAYMESLDGELICAVGEEAALLSLIGAGKREDRKALCEMLPVFCDALKNRNGNTETDGKNFNELMKKLMNCLEKEDIKNANAALGEMGKEEMTDTERDLYIELYDLMFEEKTEKAVELIKERIND
ncbi:MAG: ATP-binding protein [Treponema sp.]|nr:ATP-binding protein [Treponema sp.]